MNRYHAQAPQLKRIKINNAGAPANAKHIQAQNRSIIFAPIDNGKSPAAREVSGLAHGLILGKTLVLWVKSIRPQVIHKPKSYPQARKLSPSWGQFGVRKKTTGGRATYPQLAHSGAGATASDIGYQFDRFYQKIADCGLFEPPHFVSGRLKHSDYSCGEWA